MTTSPRRAALGVVADADRLDRRLARSSPRTNHGSKASSGRSGAERRCRDQARGALRRYFDRAWGADETRESALVVIGMNGLDQAEIRRALAREMHMLAATAAPRDEPSR